MWWKVLVVRQVLTNQVPVIKELRENSEDVVE
jgi:hypothetical protein